MKKLNTHSTILFFTLLCIIQLPANLCGMLTEQQTLPTYDVQGKIITTLLDLYLDEIENSIKTFNTWMNENHISSIFTHDTDKNFSLYKMLYWINGTRFKLLQEHINLNTASSKGNTLLHHTVFASLNCTDKTSDTNFNYNSWIRSNHFSECNGNVEMFNFTKYLLTHKANPNVHNKKGKATLCICIDNRGYYEPNEPSRPICNNIINLLLDNDANPNIASYDNSFICTLASKTFSPAIARILTHTNLQAVMNSKNENGDLPVLEAFEWYNLEFLQALADAGADFTIKNHQGLTFLEMTKQLQNNNYITESYREGHIKKIINLLERITAQK